MSQMRLDPWPTEAMREKKLMGIHLLLLYRIWALYFSRLLQFANTVQFPKYINSDICGAIVWAGMREHHLLGNDLYGNGNSDLAR